MVFKDPALILAGKATGTSADFEATEPQPPTEQSRTRRRKSQQSAKSPKVDASSGYAVPTTPSPFLNAAFAPAFVPAMGFGLDGLPQAMLQPAFDVNGQPIGFLPPYIWGGAMGLGHNSPENAGGFYGVMEDDPVNERDNNHRKAKKERNRKRAGGGDEGKNQEKGGKELPKGALSRKDVPSVKEKFQWDGEQEYTTVMLRNIPNKYTREMLVEQVSIDFKGQFDFMYLPIDFRNRCNVGYSFINFRCQDYCKRFVENFDGVDAQVCLPGLNSRKIVEVTPARVQGLEENVERLRKSPVMHQLKDHPEWMPILFDEHGQQAPFPLP